MNTPNQKKIGRKVKPRNNNTPAPVRGARWIPLSDGRFALVDKQDYGLVSRFAWSSAGGCRKSRYARTTFRGYTLYLHRLIAGAPVGFEVDHVNANRLDCRRKNLRIVTHAENMKAAWERNYGAVA